MDTRTVTDLCRIGSGIVKAGAVPSAIVTNLTDAGAAKFYGCLIQASNKLRNYNFDSLIKEWVLDVNAGEHVFDLPKDYYRLLGNENISDTLGRPLEKIGRRNLMIGDSRGARTSDSTTTFYIEGDKLYIRQLSQSVVLRFAYIIKDVWYNSSNTPLTSLPTTDASYPIIDANCMQAMFNYYLANSLLSSEELPIVNNFLKMANEAVSIYLGQQGTIKSASIINANRNNVVNNIGTIIVPNFSFPNAAG